MCVFVVDVPKKANAFGGKIRRKPNQKGAQASTRVIPNAPPVRFQSVCRAICRRATAHLGMSQNVGIRRMPARPPPVRSPSLARGESAACREATIPMADCGRADVHNRPLHPVSRRARTPHEPTQDERHTGRDRTTNERRTNNRRTQTRPLDKRPSQLRRPSIARG